MPLVNGALLIDTCRRSVISKQLRPTQAWGSASRPSLYQTAGWLAHCRQLHPSNAASLALAQDAHAHINTAEVDTILQGFLRFSHHWLYHTLVILTDSSTTYTGPSNGFLHSPPNAPIKSLLILASARDIQIVPHWLPSGKNTLADALSRNNFQEVASICPYWKDLSVLNCPRGSLHELLSSRQVT